MDNNGSKKKGLFGIAFYKNVLPKNIHKISETDSSFHLK